MGAVLVPRQDPPLAHVRFGSKADIARDQPNVCFTPKSGHQSSGTGCRLHAILLGRQSRSQYGRRAWTVISKKFNLPAGGLRSPAQKVYILHKKLSPIGLYVQSRAAPLRRARVQGWISGFGVPADPSPSLVEPRCATAATRRVLRCGATTTR